jgi:hypothetical protein
MYKWFLQVNVEDDWRNWSLFLGAGQTVWLSKTSAREYLGLYMYFGHLA